MATDREILKAADRGAAGDMSPLVSPADASDARHRRAFSFPFTDGGTAGTAVTEEVVFVAPRRAFVKAATVAFPVAVTASDTLFATVTLSKRTAGGAATVIATQTTKITGGSGNVAQFVSMPLTLTATAVQLAAGDSLTLAVAKASTGTALASATANASLTVDTEEN